MGRVRALAPAPPAGAAPVSRGVLVGVALLAVFTPLFVTADAAFAQLVDEVPRPDLAGPPGRATALASVLLAACGLAVAARQPVVVRAPRGPRRLSTTEWGVALALVDALFLAFVLVQLTVLFGGHDRVLETAGLTYAEYARSGFWQLLAASGLTLGLVELGAWAADAPRPRHRLILRALTGLLCALTLVVLASSVTRLELYEEALGLTRARLGAEAIAIWLAGIFALLLAAGAADAVRRRVPSMAAAGSALFVLAFALANPDRLIAERNIEHWRETSRIDLAYARSLSADAAPALAELPAGLRDRALAEVERQLADDEPWTSLNLAREEARVVLAER